MPILKATSLAALALAGIAVPSALAVHSSASNPAGLAAAKLASRQLATAGDGVAANPLSAVDHFKCYKASELPPPQPLPSQVTLADQFGASAVKVGPVIMLCNPVVKVHDDVTYPVSHPELHLVCFKLLQNQARNVQVRNQFGIRPLRATTARRLCLPSYKNQEPGPGLPPLGLLDHYKCYDAPEIIPTGGQPAPGIPDTVQLTDQFEQKTVKVGAAVTLCNPVRKTHDGTVTEVRYPDVHLVCFKIKEKQPPTPTVTVFNQFGKRTIAVGKPVELCLPSRKQVIG
jgi:hypothetical protein